MDMTQIFMDELGKMGGIKSEIAGQLLSPISSIGAPIGVLAGLAHGKYTPEEEAEADKGFAGNLLLPGRPAYRLTRRLLGALEKKKKE